MNKLKGAHKYFTQYYVFFLHYQVVDRSGEPVYEVDYKESRKTFTPSHIAVAIYKKMLGNVYPLCCHD